MLKMGLDRYIKKCVESDRRRSTHRGSRMPDFSEPTTRSPRQYKRPYTYPQPYSQKESIATETTQTDKPADLYLLTYTAHGGHNAPIVSDRQWNKTYIPRTFIVALFRKKLKFARFL